MSWDVAGFGRRLDEALRTFDRAAAASLCGGLIRQVWRQPEACSEAEARRIMAALRRKRYFDLMQAVGDAFIVNGQAGAEVRGQYAQALIDQGQLAAALAVLHPLVADAWQDPAAQAQARGLMGRVYKQLYVEGAEAAGARRQQHLARAVLAYWDVYREAPERHLWHGVNVVACLARARRDGLSVAGVPEPAAIACDILAAIAKRQAGGPLEAWDTATAMEACLAVGDTAGSLAWAARYVAAPDADAFELASTLRQLTEVWGLEIASEPGASLLPVLRAHLLARSGGTVGLPMPGRSAGAPPSGDEASAGSVGRCDDTALEKILGRDGCVTLRWYQLGLERCRAVARVETIAGEGFGTGFMLDGGQIHPSLAGESFLLTNAHVLSDPPAVRDALRPADAQVTFEARRGEAGVAERYGVKDIVFSSPPGALDATLARLDPAVTGGGAYRIAASLPALDQEHRVYVIGHPRGAGLSLSLQDNLLLDHEAPLIHYRTPTEPGSSGSPVFNRQWDLIGLHHAGSLSMRKLHGEGTYAANEGIWIQAIVQEIAKTIAAP